MPAKSVFIPEPSIQDNIITIVDEEHHHLAVTRAVAGDLVEVFDGRGKVWLAELVEIARKKSRARVLESREIGEPGVGLILALAMVRMSAFELALEKAVELGVTRIVPFIAARSNVTESRRHDRWERIVVEAAKQSKRFHLPQIDQVQRFESMLQIPAGTRVVFSERGGRALSGALKETPVLYAVGPEGGWSDGELQLLRDAGFIEVSLGSGILRSETAAIVGASLIRYELGEF